MGLACFLTKYPLSCLSSPLSTSFPLRRALRKVDLNVRHRHRCISFFSPTRGVCTLGSPKNATDPTRACPPNPMLQQRQGERIRSRFYRWPDLSLISFFLLVIFWSSGENKLSFSFSGSFKRLASLPLLPLGRMRARARTVPWIQISAERDCEGGAYATRAKLGNR